MKIFAFLVPFILFSSLLRGEVLLPEVPRNAAGLGESLRSNHFRIELREMLSQRIGALNEELGETNDEDDRDDLEDVLDILTFARSQLVDEGASDREIVRGSASAYRIFLSVQRGKAKQQLPPFNILFRNVVWGTLFGHGIPLVPEGLRAQPVSDAAAQESPFLFDPSRDAFYTTDELSRKSPEEIAGLDIGPGHPAWLSWAEKSQYGDDRIEQFEGEMIDGVSKALWSKGDLMAGREYPLNEARKVLFLEEVYLSATSPKVETEDVFGVEWKLKWGDEPAIEPVANRLYLLAGGRATDLVFANEAGSNELTLILNKAGATADDEKGDDERHAETVAQLSEALRDFYGFDLAPYILETGVITEANVGHILRHLPHGGDEDLEPSRLMGRHWVTFKESGVELKPKKFIRREDGAPLSDMISRHDRATRGLYLFDLWIENRDVKDDNQKAFYQRTEGVGGDWAVSDYYEGHHDLGLSLGGLSSSGKINRLRSGNRFAGEGFGKLRFKAPIFFKPKSWKHATWADGKWMARHIATISEPKIRAAVAKSKWPDFMQEALVYRLLTRRNEIAKLYELGDLLDCREIAPPSFSIVLDNPRKVAELEKRYGLPAGALEHELGRDPLQFGRVETETVVHHGVVVPSRRSALIRTLTKYRYPSGLTERYQRQSDRHPPGI